MNESTSLAAFETPREFMLNGMDDLDAVVESVCDILMLVGPDLNSGFIIALQGDVGAGKTTFTKRLAAKLGIAETLTSPTFVILKKYPISLGGNTGKFPFQQLVHIDAYRLNGGEDLNKLGFNNLITSSSPKSIICLEWPELVADIIPAHHLSVTFEHVMPASALEGQPDAARRKVTVSLKV